MEEPVVNDPRQRGGAGGDGRPVRPGGDVQVEQDEPVVAAAGPAPGRQVGELPGDARGAEGDRGHGQPPPGVEGAGHLGLVNQHQPDGGGLGHEPLAHERAARALDDQAARVHRVGAVEGQVEGPAEPSHADAQLARERRAGARGRHAAAAQAAGHAARERADAGGRGAAGPEAHLHAVLDLGRGGLARPRPTPALVPPPRAEGYATIRPCRRSPPGSR